LLSRVEAAPERPSRGPIAVALTVLLGVLGIAIGIVLWRSNAPEPCPRDSFVSERFGYCVSLPRGWDAIDPAFVGSTIDRFEAPSGGGTIDISAVPLQEGQDIDVFAAYVRTLDERSGLKIDEDGSESVGDVTARSFDVSTASGGDPTLGREVVFVRDGFAWRVQMSDASGAFEATAELLDDMLESWIFL
jgi:hypothetical protein